MSRSSQADLLLARAISDDDLELASRAIDSGADLERPGEAGTPLQRAVQHRRMTMVGLLLDRGAQPSTMGRLGMTPLHLAAQMRDVAMVEMLLERGADPHIQEEDDLGVTPLMSATAASIWDPMDPVVKQIIAVFVRAGADFRATDRKGNSVLRLGHQYIEELCAAGADPDQVNLDGDSEMMKDYEEVLSNERWERLGRPAFDAKRLEIHRSRLERMRAGGGKGTGFVHIDLLDACACGDLERAKLALAAGASIHHRGNGPLEIAASCNQPEIIRFLAAAGANIDNPSTRVYPWTALMMAVRDGKLEAVKALVECGADPTFCPRKKGDLLDLSRECKHPAITAYLESLPHFARGRSEMPAAVPVERMGVDAAAVVAVAHGGAVRVAAQGTVLVWAEDGRCSLISVDRSVESFHLPFRDIQDACLSPSAAYIGVLMKHAIVIVRTADQQIVERIEQECCAVAFDADDRRWWTAAAVGDDAVRLTMHPLVGQAEEAVVEAEVENAFWPMLTELEPLPGGGVIVRVSTDLQDQQIHVATADAVGIRILSLDRSVHDSALHRDGRRCLMIDGRGRLQQVGFPDLSPLATVEVGVAGGEYGAWYAEYVGDTHAVAVDHRRCELHVVDLGRAQVLRTVVIRVPGAGTLHGETGDFGQPLRFLAVPGGFVAQQDAESGIQVVFWSEDALVGK